MFWRLTRGGARGLAYPGLLSETPIGVFLKGGIVNQMFAFDVRGLLGVKSMLIRLVDKLN
jgi:hypothetical protein